MTVEASADGVRQYTPEEEQRLTANLFALHCNVDERRYSTRTLDVLRCSASFIANSLAVFETMRASVADPGSVRSV